MARGTAATAGHKVVAEATGGLRRRCGHILLVQPLRLFTGTSTLAFLGPRSTHPLAKPSSTQPDVQWMGLPAGAGPFRPWEGGWRGSCLEVAGRAPILEPAPLYHPVQIPKCGCIASVVLCPPDVIVDYPPAQSERLEGTGAKSGPPSVWQWVWIYH